MRSTITKLAVLLALTVSAGACTPFAPETATQRPAQVEHDDRAAFDALVAEAVAEANGQPAWLPFRPRPIEETWARQAEINWHEHQVWMAQYEQPDGSGRLRSRVQGHRLTADRLRREAERLPWEGR